MRAVKSIQWRITIPFVVLVLVSMGTIGAYLVNFVKDSQLNNLRFHLEEEARTISEATLPLLMQGDDTDAFVKQLNRATGARVTIIAADGRVLGDSREDPAAMENHGSRPEVRDALAKGRGEITRYSTTYNEKMQYMAVPAASGGKVYGIVRTALPLASIEESEGRLALTVILSMGIVAILMIAAAAMIARATAGPIRQLTRAANQITAGRLGSKIAVQTGDEVGELGTAFNEMSSSLKRTVDALSSEKVKLSTVLDNIADGVILTDRDGRVSIINRAAGRLFKIEDNDARGKPLIEVVHDHEADDAMRACLRAGAEQSTQYESCIEKRFLRLIITPVASVQAGELLFLFQDLTEARDLQTMRKELVGNISHDLRTPLASVSAMVETLRDGAIDDREAAADFLARIESEVDRMSQMVSELTELTRMETGKADLRIAAVDLNALVEEVVGQMGPLAERQDVSISASPGRGLPVIEVDKDRIKQALVNLVHNAIKFNRAGGRVVVTTRVEGEEAVVEISDTGTGISAGDLPHVFERFYKADRGRSGGGSGLGLAIARQTALAHGGSIRAVSEPGRGSTFTLSLPLH